MLKIADQNFLHILFLKSARTHFSSKSDIFNIINELHCNERLISYNIKQGNIYSSSNNEKWNIIWNSEIHLRFSFTCSSGIKESTVKLFFREQAIWSLRVILKKLLL